MSLHPRLACGLLTAAVVGNVVPAANVATHCSSNVEIFASAADRKEEVREIKRSFSKTSDHSALHLIQNEFEQKLVESGWRDIDKWCDKYGLRKERLGLVKSLSNLHLQQLLESGIIEPSIDVEELNRFSEIDELIAAVLLAGSNSVLLTKSRLKTKGKLKTAVEIFTGIGERAHIGGESVNYNVKKERKPNLLAYFGGFHSVERRALVVHKTSLITPQMALLFCKGDILKVTNVENETMLTLPRCKFQIYVPTRQVENIINAKEMLWKTINYYIERDTKDLDYEENSKVSKFKLRLIKIIGRILFEADREYNQGKSRDFMENDEVR